MKSIFRIFLAFILSASLSSAGLTVRLTWDAPAATDPQPSGYALYRKGGTPTAPTWTLVRRYETAQVVSTRLIDITSDGAGTYALTAFNAGGESDMSVEITIPGKPGAPAGVRIQLEFTP